MDEAADIARLQAQARLIAAYEESNWPRRPPSTADLIRHLMDQHGLSRADMVPILGTPSRVSEVLKGKKGLPSPRPDHEVDPGLNRGARAASGLTR